MTRALRYRNYRLFFGGQMVSLVGTWMSTTAISWLVYRLTGSALLLGAVGFAGQIPAFLLAPLAGVYVDRWDRHRVLVFTQVAAMIQSAVLAALTLTGLITVPAILALAAVQGVINAFDMPSRQSLVVSLIENKQDLGNAIALNSSMVNFARLLGPAIGGLIIAAVGEGWCFAIDAVSYAGVIVALLAMRLTAGPRPPTRGAARAFREGFSYVVGSRPILSIIVLLALVSLFGMPYTVLMPVFAADILGGGPHTLGFLLTGSGLGALMGALWLASRRTILGLGRLIAGSVLLFGLTLIALSTARTLWVALILMPFAGLGFIVQVAGSNTIVQTIVDEDKRGRVMSFFMMAFLGAAPIGSLIGGALADRIGVPATLVLGGSVCGLGGVAFAFMLPLLRRHVRPIYARLGILPEIAAGLQSSTQLSIPPED